MIHRRTFLSAAIALSTLFLVTAPLAGQGPGCTERDETPGELGFGTYFDSAIIASVVQREWDDDWGSVVGYLSSDSTSNLGKVTLYSTAPDPAPVQRLAQWMESARTGVAFPDSSSMSFVLADGKDMRPRSVTELKFCAPVVLNRNEIGGELHRQWKELEYRSLKDQTLLTLVWAFVEADGTVGKTEVRESSGIPEWDAIAVDAAQKANFVPALLEGVPYPVWVELPMTKQPGR